MSRAADLKRKYDITEAQYARRLKDQGGGCAICGSTPKKRRLHVDHDHKTGKVRGLLCMSCNRGLGWFKDKPGRLHNAAEYLEEE